MSTDTIQSTGSEKLRKSDTFQQTELHSGDFITIDPDEGGSNPEVGFVFFGNAEVLNQIIQHSRDKILETPGLGFTVVDLSKCPVDTDGQPVYDGVVFDKKTRALVVDEGQVEWGKGVGYQEICLGGCVTLGKENTRFPRFLSTTSRKHCGITVDAESGAITVVDANSKNGTTVLTGNLDLITSGNTDVAESIPTDDKGVDWAIQNKPVYTKELGPTHMTEEACQSFVNALRSSNDQFETTKQLMSYKALEPIAGLDIKGKKIMFSRIFNSGTRLSSVAYSKGDDGKISPAYFYKSNSDGGWRVTPGFYHNGTCDKGGMVVRDDKGELIHYGQYTQATKPSEYITALLEDMEESARVAPADVTPSSDDLLTIFNFYKMKREGIDVSLQNQTVTTLVRAPGMDAYRPGTGFTEPPGVSREKIKNMKLPEGFEPDFTKEPVKSYVTKHTILGPCRVEVFPSVLPSGSPAEWHVACNLQTDTVWLERVVDASPGAGVTLFGTYDHLVLAGALSAKPIEYAYADQLQQMEGEIDYTYIGEGYASLKPLLDTMPWIIRYRDIRPQKGLTRE